MQRRSVGLGLFLAAAILLVPLSLGGCADESRTTGTQVQVSEETKAQIQDMREMYKDMKKETTKKKAKR